MHVDAVPVPEALSQSGKAQLGSTHIHGNQIVVAGVCLTEIKADLNEVIWKKGANPSLA